MKLLVVDPGIKNCGVLRLYNNIPQHPIILDFTEGGKWGVGDIRCLHKAREIFDNPYFTDTIEEVDMVAIERQYVPKLSKVPIMIQRILGVLMSVIPPRKYFESDSRPVKNYLRIAKGTHYNNKKAVKEFARPFIMNLRTTCKLDDIADCFAHGYYLQNVKFSKEKIGNPWKEHVEEWRKRVAGNVIPRPVTTRARPPHQ